MYRRNSRRNASSSSPTCTLTDAQTFDQITCRLADVTQPIAIAGARWHVLPVPQSILIE
jgi:hypothetical protein